MKKLILLCTFLCLQQIYSQYKKGRLYFIDGTNVIGLVKEKNLGGIKFKEDSDSKPVSYTYEKLSGYDIGDEKYRYLNIAYSPQLFLFAIEGKMNLYISQRANTSMVMGPDGTLTAGPMAGTSNVYYIETFGKFIKLGGKLKKKHWFHFSACPGLEKKIKAKEFEKWDLEGIVNYYNQHYYDEQ